VGFSTQAGQPITVALLASMLTVFTTEMIISLFAAVTVTALHILLERERERERERDC